MFDARKNRCNALISSIYSWLKTLGRFDRPRQRYQGYGPRLELLEDRLAPATFRVIGIGDATGAVAEIGIGAPGEYRAPTLRSAIDAANNETSFPGPDRIVFDLFSTPSTIYAAGNDTNRPYAFGPTAYVINSDITIAGDVTEPAVTIDGQNLRRLFGVMAGASLTMENVTLAHGKVKAGNGGNSYGNSGAGGGAAGLGGAIFTNGNLTLKQVTLTDNVAQGGNGGSYLSVTGGGLARAAGGGGVGGDGGDAVLGGGGGGGGVAGPGTSIGVGNREGGSGGPNEFGQAAEGGGSFGSEFRDDLPAENGTAGGGGGGGYGFVNSYPAGNGLGLSSGGFGGGGGGAGFHSINGAPGGFASGGGGGHSLTSGGAGGFGGGGGGALAGISGPGGFGGGDGGDGYTTETLQAGGGGAGMGGAIFNNGGVVNITASTFANNTARGGDPGNYDVNPAFAGGPGPGKGFGGALFNNGGTVNVTNSTFSGNLASGGRGYPIPSFYPPISDQIFQSWLGLGLGGGIFNYNGALAVFSSTLANNHAILNADPAAEGGRAIFSLGDGAGSTAQVSLYSSILGQSDTIGQDFTAVTARGGSSVTLGSSNLIRTQSGFSGGILSTADPLLDVLRDNGGPTTTFGLLPGSPAIDAGTGERVPDTDQRGVARPQNGAVDLGAFERRGSLTISIPSGDHQMTPLGTPFAQPLRVNVSSTAGEPVAGGRVLFTSPGSGASTATASTTTTIDADGNAVVSAEANGIVGAYTVTASVETISVGFSLKNAPLLGDTLPRPFLGDFYRHAPVVTGGTGPYAVALTGGALPPGLSTSADGFLEGTPTATGTYHFTLTATDVITPGGPFFVSQAYSVEVLDLVVSTVLDENDGDFRPGDLSLREAIALANTNPDLNTITFAPMLTDAGPLTLELTQAGDDSAGWAALLVSSAVIVSGPTGNHGVRISRGATAVAMRLFNVGLDASLTLENLTLSNGLAQGGSGGAGGGGAAGLGGAIFNRGSLTLTGATLESNHAQGGNGGPTYSTYGGGGGGLAGDGEGDGSYFANGGGPNAGVILVSGEPSSPVYPGYGGGGWGGRPGISGLPYIGIFPDPRLPPGLPQQILWQFGIGGGGESGANGGFGGGGASGALGAITFLWPNTPDRFYVIPPGGSGGAGGFGGGGGGGNHEGQLLDWNFSPREPIDPDAPGDGVGGQGGFGGGAGEDAVATSDPVGGRGGGGAGLGGAIFSDGGTVSILNSTLTNNSVVAGSGYVNGQAFGGAIFSRNGALTITNSTISNNSAADGGRGIYTLGDGATITVQLDNTIVGQSDTLVSDYVGNTINGGVSNTSGAGNLIRTAVGFNGVIVSNGDPRLGALASNGGPTPTMALLFDSPARNAGSNSAATAASLTTDQRGSNRFIGAVDIGAFEAAANSAPVLNPQAFSLAENSPNLVVVGTVVANDPDSGQTLTWSISAGNTGNAFTIDPGTGQITVNNSAALNYESTPTFSLTIQVSDNGAPSLSTSTTITINLIDVNETPFLNGQTFSLPENSPMGLQVGYVIGSDPDAGQILTYAIISGNANEAFAIDPQTGRLTVANAAALDFETTPTFTLTIQATDNGSPNRSTTAQVVINLQDVVEGLTGVDVTSRIALTRGGYKYNRTTALWEQAITLKNSSQTSMTGTIELVLENLTTGIGVVASAEYVVTNPSAGRYVVMIPRSKLASLAAGQRYQLNLFFSNPLNKTITYDWKVFSNPGS